MTPKGAAGVVISAGKMMKTVKVRMVRQHWNRRLRKNFNVPYNILVHDPNASLVEGDVIATVPERHSRHVQYAVSSILAPFGTPVEERPPLLTQEERETIRAEEWARRLERKKAWEANEAKLRAEEKLAKRRKGPVKRVDDGGEGAGKGAEGQGRVVMPQGLHEFGAINQEARQGKRRETRLVEKGLKNEKNREKAEVRPEEELQGEALGR